MTTIVIFNNYSLIRYCSIPETPTTSIENKFAGSPGLRRKLLASELRTRDDSTLTPSLTKPRPVIPHPYTGA